MGLECPVLSNRQKQKDNISTLGENSELNNFSPIAKQDNENNTVNNQIKPEDGNYNSPNLNEIAKIKQVHENLLKENQKLKNEFEKYKKEYINIKKQNDILEDKFKKMQKENNNLTEKNENLNTKLNDYKTQVDKIADLKAQLEKDYENRLNNEKITYIQNVKSKEKEIENLTNENKNLKQKEDENKIELNQLQTQLKRKDEDNKSKLNELENKLKQKEEDIRNLEYQLNQKEKDNEELQKKIDELTPITIGLDNIGATCYMNATLQSFSNVPQLTSYFLKKYKPDKNKRMSNEYYTVIQNLWDKDKNGKSYAPESFKKVLSEMNPMFAGIAANDSKDLINFLIETFHSELNEVDEKNLNNNMISSADQLDENKMLNIFLTDMKARYNSPISSLFYGVLETQSQCTNCKRIKYNFQIYSFLEFPLEQVNMYCFRNNRRLNFNGQGNPDIDLYECFDHYQAILTMNGDNQIYCNECGKLFDALYVTYLYSMPNYLIINLNRGKNAVYQCNVKFPEILNLYNHVKFNKSNCVFQLQSVICHIGPSSMGGHFIAYCRHHKDNNWYKYNDSIVTKCTSHNEYLNGMPYILFYKALDDK